MMLGQVTSSPWMQRVSSTAFLLHQEPVPGPSGLMWMQDITYVIHPVPGAGIWLSPIKPLPAFLGQSTLSKQPVTWLSTSLPFRWVFLAREHGFFLPSR